MYFSREGPSLLMCELVWMCELETLKFDIDNKCFRLRVRVTVSINVKIKEAESLMLDKYKAKPWNNCEANLYFVVNISTFCKH